MRVLVVTNMYPTEAEPWFGTFVAEQVEDLRALGVEIEVMSIDGRRHRSAYAAATAGVRKRVRTGFDLVHAHYGLTGAVALAQNRLPVVTTFHGSDAGYVPWQLWVSRVVARHTAPIVVAPGLAAKLKCAGAAVIPMGVDLDRFRTRHRREVRAMLRLDADLPHVLFPGSRHNRVKRADLFDAAVTEARRELPELRALALEGLTREEAALTISAADVMLMTSDSEGSPVVVKESLACGTPVVSTPVGDVPLVLDGLPGCAISEGEPRALAQALLKALEAGGSPALRERAAEFARPRMAQRVVGVYARVLGERSQMP